VFTQPTTAQRTPQPADIGSVLETIISLPLYHAAIVTTSNEIPSSCTRVVPKLNRIGIDSHPHDRISIGIGISIHNTQTRTQTPEPTATAALFRTRRRPRRVPRRFAL